MWVRVWVKIQQNRKRGTRYITWTCKVPVLLLCKRGEHNHRSQTTSSNLQKRCSNTITESKMNSTKIHQYKDRVIYKSEPELFIADWLCRQNKENKDVEIPGIQLNTNTTQTTPKSKIAWQYRNYNRQLHMMKTYNRSKTHHQRLAREQRSNATRHENMLDILRWHGSDWQGYNEKAGM